MSATNKGKNSATVVASEGEQDRRELDDKTKLNMLPFVDAEKGERALTGDDELPPPDQQDLDFD